MPFKTHRPAPPPPGGTSRINNMTRPSTFKSHVPNDTVNNNAKVLSRPTVIRPVGLKPAKKKPPPRPAPPKNYQAKTTSTGYQKSSTPDLLADLRDIFTTPINPSQQQQQQQSNKPNIIKPLNSGPARASFKKTPAPARPPPSALNKPLQQQQSRNITSLIDFDTPPPSTNHAQSLYTNSTNKPQSKSTLNDLFDLDPFFSKPSSNSSNNKSSAASTLTNLAINNPNATKKVASIAWTTMVNNPNATKAVASTAWNAYTGNSSSTSNKTNNGPGTSVFSSKTTAVTTTSSNKHVENFLVNKWNNSNGQEKNTPMKSNSSYNTTSSEFSTKTISNTSSSVTKSVFSPPEPQFPPPPPPPVVEDETISPLMSPLSKCEALFDFVANDSDELSFKTGDIVGLVDKPSEDWWLGTLNGDKGLFPSTYVKVLSQDENFSQLSQTSSSKTDGCFVKALYTFEAEQDGDLAFQEGDDIEVLYRINQNWLYGKSNGKEGQFPANFVQKSEENDQENQNNLSICVAKYQFIPENADELSFEEGDRIVIVEKLSSDWWKGYLYSDKSQKNGIFPSTFVVQV